MEISLDNFIEGKIKIYQPKKGYRAGIDAVLLASCVQVFKKCKILDIGSGTGVISLFIASKYKNVEIVGIEKNFKYARMPCTTVFWKDKWIEFSNRETAR